MFNSLLSERLAVVGTIDPADHDTTEATSDWVDMSKRDKLLAIVLAGGLTGTLDAKLQQATDSSGTDAKDITDKAITQLADTDDDTQAMINLRADELDIEGGFTHVALVLTPTGGTTNDAAAVLLGGDAKNEPASDDDLASVAEIVA